MLMTPIVWAQENGEFHIQLSREPDVTHPRHPLTSAHYASFLPNVGKFDGCIDFDFRRYQRDALELTMHDHTSEATIVLVITGPWFSQAAEVADLVSP